MRFPEFIVLIAALSSIVALSIDIMLPVLPQIGNSYAVTVENDRQAVLVLFMLGFGLAQIVFGPLSDRFGRKIVLISGVVFYGLSSVLAAVADSFTLLLLLRVTQGIGAAAVRIVVIAIVRDCFGGREMARVMSLQLHDLHDRADHCAPPLGQSIANLLSWHWFFVLLGVASCALAIWAVVRLEETLQPEQRLPFSMRAVGPRVF